MATEDYVEIVEVLRGHLEEIYLAVDAAYGHITALDLAEHYKTGKGLTKPSYLQKKLASAGSRIEGYLYQGETDESV